MGHADRSHSADGTSITLRQALAEAAETIDRQDATVLLFHVLGRDRAWLYAHANDPLEPAQQGAFQRAVEARQRRTPLQYITGHQEFYGLDLQLSPATLIPRPETELLVEAVLRWAQQLDPQPTAARPLRIADVGTGSGAIALALAANLPHAQVHALDISVAVREVVEANARHLCLAERVQFCESDLLSALQSALDGGLRLDAVVSNPPYIPDGDAAELQPEVRDFEPHTALFAGPDGLDLYRRLIPAAAAALRPHGLLATEFGFGQQPALERLLRNWHDVRFHKDLAGIPRVVLALRPS